MTITALAATTRHDQLPPEAAASSGVDRAAFLAQAVAFADGSVRAFDTRAQIAIAAFAFSFGPLWSLLRADVGHVPSEAVAFGLGLGYVLTLLAFCSVLWPFDSPARPHPPGGQGLFALADADALDPSRYLARLARLAPEPELVGVLISLSAARRGKARRLRVAMGCAAAFYTGALLTLARA